MKQIIIKVIKILNSNFVADFLNKKLILSHTIIKKSNYEIQIYEVN
jgi:hypothetical protein